MAEGKHEIVKANLGLVGEGRGVAIVHGEGQKVGIVDAEGQPVDIAAVGETELAEGKGIE